MNDTICAISTALGVGAISITKSGYYIDPAKCVHCKACMNPRILDGGCAMDKYLRTK